MFGRNTTEDRERKNPTSVEVKVREDERKDPTWKLKPAET